MEDSIINLFDKYGGDLLLIQTGLMVIISGLFLWLWFSNRRKYHNLKHAIPANVVKNYLDSIIQNSTALKSSLFRGGGLEANGGVPSVMPLTQLSGGDNLAVSGAPSTALLEELNQKKAIIASLEAQLSSSQSAQRELEAKLAQTKRDLGTAEERIRELEALLAQSRSAGGGDEALKSELNMITKERNELRDRLKEFEIISDDLANLKRLQQENDQLKRSLTARGGSIPEVSEPEPEQAPASMASVNDFLEDVGQKESSLETDASAFEDFLGAPAPDVSIPAPEPEPVPEPEPAPASAPEEEMVAAMEEAAPAEEERPRSEKTPEDLLSEFEKMLG